ncbi:hypothetical protein [Dysgonomonas capnocytophagoides]|uniref:hypothetical protein n=1 Tax=Dysgonomonas capnocytophagoides TaxID=45254 RepID=UPI002920D00D|nr:hypothetical protein DCPSUM001_33740 [Dysgonomonas capnocytophagoides]
MKAILIVLVASLVFIFTSCETESVYDNSEFVGLTAEKARLEYDLTRGNLDFDQKMAVYDSIQVCNNKIATLK